MKFVDKKTIELDRELSDLDIFALDFIRILENHTNYVLVSGYVSILLGRSRASEDVDIIIPKISYSKFQALYKDLKNNGFICLNAENIKSIFSYLEDELAIRFARKLEVIPNIEFKWVKNKFEDIALNSPVIVKLREGTLKISPLELQVAFKQEVLKSPKDLEDARHIEKIAENYLDAEMINKYREMLREFYK
jgi:hypothetical protein